LGIDGVGAQPGDVRIAVLPSQHGQGEGAQQIGQCRCIGTGETQRTLAHPVGEESPGGQKLRQEDPLAQRRDRRGRIPLNMKTPAQRVHRQRAGENRAGGGGADVLHFTLRVKCHRSNL
jgi:hypothetical protein